jgi:hypothetical protein
MWQIARAGRVERIKKSSARSPETERGRGSMVVPEKTRQFAPAPSPSDASGCTADLRGYNRHIAPPDKTRSAYQQGYRTDEELQTQSLEAWRIRLRTMHDYIPDIDWDKKVHLYRVKSSRQLYQTSRESAKRKGCKEEL